MSQEHLDILSFANFYKNFLKNFSRIVVPLASIFEITNEFDDNESQFIQLNNNKKIQDISSNANISLDDTGDNVINKSIQNLSYIANLAKSKKSNLTKSKKSNLRIKKSDFAKTNYSEMDFLTFKAKKAFIHL